MPFIKKTYPVNYRKYRNIDYSYRFVSFSGSAAIGTTEAKIVSTLRSKYEAPEVVIEKDVHKVITELKKIGAIDG